MIRMALYLYYQPVQGDNLSDPKGPLSTTILRQVIAEANKQVQEEANAKARDGVFTRHCCTIVS